MLGTLMLISAWYTYATLFLRFTKGEMGDAQILSIFPGAACINYALLLWLTWVTRDTLRFNLRFLVWWLAAVFVAIAAKIPLAAWVQSTLPARSPRGYGDCFVVSAATRGRCIRGPRTRCEKTPV